MKSLFSGYYFFSDSELADLWKNCTFIFDTNVLLNLYRYPKATSDELLKILKRISGQLWIPFQVGLEYQENRLDVINEQVEMFHKVQEALKKGKESLEQNLNQLQLKKRHSLIDPTELLEKIDNAITEFQQNLELLQEKQPNVFDYDQLREEIASIFEGKIGQPPSSQEELNAIYAEGKRRYDQKYPPGYMDIDKDNELRKRKERTVYLYSGLSFERKYGDLILWYQIIEEAEKNDKLKKIIYVSGDVKEDWWYKADRFGSRQEAILGARPELVQEISSKSGVVAFHMYQTDRVLIDANRYLGTQVSQEAVEQIRDVNMISVAAGSRNNFIQISDVLAVLGNIYESYYKGAPIRELRKNAIDAVASEELYRFQDLHSAKETIRDACTRRLGVKGIKNFEDLVESWLCEGSDKLKDVLLDCSDNTQAVTAIHEFFDQ